MILLNIIVIEEGLINYAWGLDRIEGDKKTFEEKPYHSFKIFGWELYRLRLDTLTFHHFTHYFLMGCEQTVQKYNTVYYTKWCAALMYMYCTVILNTSPK